MKITDNLTYMLAMTIEYVNGVCDENYNFDTFFEDMEISKKARNDFAVAAMLSQARERGLI